MRLKTHNVLLILTSLVGYLEWGQDQHMFLFEGEWDVITKLFSEPGSVMHPFVLLPMLGQILLLITLFRKSPSVKLTLTGITGIGVLLVFILFVGILAMNIRIVLSVLPFILLSIFVLFNHRQTAKQ